MPSKNQNDDSRLPRVLWVSPEAVPFAKTGGLADVAGTLPPVLSRRGVVCGLILPKYACVSAAKVSLKQVAKFHVPMGMGEVDSGLWEGVFPDRKTPVWFIENDRYFNREALYGTPSGDYGDNAERFAFFCRAVLEAIPFLPWKPEILHLNDWQTGLIAAYLRTLYRDSLGKELRTVFTIHNLAYQGLFPKYVLPMTGIGWEEFHHEKLEYYDQVGFLKAGLVYSDRLTTVSPRYAEEIQTEAFGCGLEGVLRRRKSDLRGILNGIDPSEWNPASDSELPANYTARTLERKNEIKKILQAEVGLPKRSDVPLFGMVTRLADQKGLDLLAAVFDALMEEDLQLVLLGTGEERYHRMMQDRRTAHADKFAAALRFDAKLAKWIYAGSDFFLMPSRFEPCGLGQLIAMRYGTIPVVRKTGGLADTVPDCSEDPEGGLGITFEAYEPKSFQEAVRRALAVYRDPALKNTLARRAMEKDFSWDASAERYRDFYLELLKQTG